MNNTYDLIVVGGGHAGCEAAYCSSKMGIKTLLVTMDISKVAQMSCNPAMGGIAKGQIIREIDALGGASGMVSDLSSIQFRMLNRSKGPAMWSPRTQNDRMLFSYHWRCFLEKSINLDFWQDIVNSLIIKNNTVVGVKTNLGLSIYSKTVILTNGTFLNGKIHIGEKVFTGGRFSESASFGITEQLNSLGFSSGRMKTGTPPRIDGRTLEYDKMEEQKGDENPHKFSFSPKINPLKNQKSCYLTHTNKIVHEILQNDFEKSPMFNGSIKGLGPRYCPSIEDKINRFSDKDKHLLFIEPEGWNTIEIYVNGFSTSLPEETQLKALRQIKGLENVKMFRPGYAIEYDFFHPTQLLNTLETKNIKNLFLSGQINGTTGYEEAACQGLMAGINAAHKVLGKESFVLNRNEAYIGVLIDDLITKGTNEPYRMFTSRAEYRIVLRQDNADLRLTEKGFKIGLVSEERMNMLNKKRNTIDVLHDFIIKNSAIPNEVNDYLISKKTNSLTQKVKLDTLISRPQVELKQIIKRSKCLNNFVSTLEIYSEEIEQQVEILIKYKGYLNKEQEMVERMKRLEYIKLHKDFDYYSVKSLSEETKEKLTKIKPENINQVSRISGIRPADITIILNYIGR